MKPLFLSLVIFLGLLSCQNSALEESISKNDSSITYRSLIEEEALFRSSFQNAMQVICEPISGLDSNLLNSLLIDPEDFFEFLENESVDVEELQTDLFNLFSSAHAIIIAENEEYLEAFINEQSIAFATNNSNWPLSPAAYELTCFNLLLTAYVVAGEKLKSEMDENWPLDVDGAINSLARFGLRLTQAHLEFNDCIRDL